MDSQYSTLLSSAYIRLHSLPGFPWPSSDLFVQEWTEFLVVEKNSPYSLRVRTKLKRWDGAGCGQVFRVLEALTQPGVYPAPMGNAVRKLKREIVEGLEDSSGSSTLNESGSGESQLGNSMGGPLMFSSPPVTDIEAAEQTPPFCDMDMEDDSSIISNSEDQTQVTEGLAFSEISLADSEAPVPCHSHFTSTFLENLIKVKKNSKKGAPVEHPKKEYFRCQHIRALKKSLRQLKEKKMPGASIHRVNRSKDSQVRKWEEMKEFYRANWEELDRMAATTAGPLTDGKSRREEIRVIENTAKSYNDNFVRYFFSFEVIRIYNRMFSDLVYDCSPAEICEKMKKTKCCQGSHSEHCQEVWAQACEYAKEGMWQELAAKQL